VILKNFLMENPMRTVILALLCMITLVLGASENNVPSVRPVGSMELVANFPDAMLTGITVSREGRIFVNFPRWGDDVPFTVAEVKDGKAEAYPDAAINKEGPLDSSDTFISVQSVVVDPADRLWIVDTGSPEFKPVKPGGPKLMCYDLKTNRLIKKIVMPADALAANSYLNDIRFNLKQGAGGTAFITDSSDKGENAIIVVDLASGKARRRLKQTSAVRAMPAFLPIVEGRPMLKHEKDGSIKHLAMGSDGIAISGDGAWLYFCPLASRHLWKVSTAALADSSNSDAEVEKTLLDLGDRGFASDGLESDAENRVYLTDYEHHSIMRMTGDGAFETLVHDPRIIWPDTMSLASDGYLYFTNNQLNRQKSYEPDGKDARVKPYTVWRIKVDGHRIQ
jgi:sugar lactone lactonase YvrE